MTKPDQQQDAVDRSVERDRGITEISAYWEILRDHTAPKPEVREIRIFGARDRDSRTDSGYFGDGAAASQAAGWHDYYNKPHGTFITLNPCVAECLSKADGRIRDFVGQGKTTADKEIVVRRWQPIDIDPVSEKRLTGIPATDLEYEVSIAIRGKILDWLVRKFGFPAMLEADSGNGGLALIPIDLPNDDESKELCRRFLLACDQYRIEFKIGDGAKVDGSMFNASRVSRMMGLFNRKGDSRPERPHRQAHLTFVPEYLKNGWCSPVGREQFAAVAALAKDDPPKGKGKPARGSVNGHSSSTTARYARRLNMEKYLAARGLAFNPIQETDGTRFDLPCVQHDDHMASFYQYADGRPGYNCFHDRCKHFRWEEASAKIGRPDSDHYDQTGSLIASAGIDLTLDNLPWIPSEGDWVKTKDRGNYGTVIEQNGTHCRVRFVSKEGQEAVIDYDAADLEAAGGDKGSNRPQVPLERVTVRQLQADHPRLHSPVIDQWIREGETGNIISGSKIGKSWLVYYILICFVSVRAIFDRFSTAGGRALLIDNELHKPTLASRLRTVAEAMGVQADEYADRIDVLSLRGNLRSIFELGAELKDVKPGDYKLIVLDAKYRALAPDAEENSNSDETRFYNEADRLAAQTGAALLMVHHSSKGTQGEKRVTDVGAGAGAQSRAADCHLILREHEQPDAIVLDAAVRSFQPLEPMVLRWRFPLWEVDDTLDPTLLKGKQSPQDEKRSNNDRDTDEKIVADCQTWKSRSELRISTGYGADRLNRGLRRLIDAKLLQQSTEDHKGNQCEVFRKTIHAK